jgi:WS/DGAT C-terminal domain
MRQLSPLDAAVSLQGDATGFLPPGTGLSLVAISYLGSLNFGLVICPDLVPDVAADGVPA